MGREVVFANIRKRMIAMIVGGVILTLMVDLSHLRR